MIGVVLWSDPREGKAVIWCEDHGELAFYRGVESPGDDPQIFGAGDLIEFEVVTGPKLRYAYNPEVIEGGLYRDLPCTLASQAVQKQADIQERAATACVIPLFQPKSQSADVRRERELSVQTG